MTRALLRRRALLSGAVVLAAAAAGSGSRAFGDDRPAAGMKARVFEVKHQEPEGLVRPLEPLLSGAKGARINSSNSLRTITVRDFPENLAAIEQALRRLDVPTPPKPDIEIRLRILIATPTGEGNVPADLANVVRQLQANLNYKGYYQIAPISARVRAGQGTSGRGETRLEPPLSDEPTTAHYSYGVEQVQLVPGGAGGAQVIQLRKLKFELDGKHLGEAEVSTGVSLTEGEKVVVGTGTLKSRAMIVVVFVKVLR
jgi:hypothetical protein